MAVEIFTISEAAEVMGIPQKAMRRRVERRCISCQKIGGRWIVALDPDDFRKKEPTAK